MENLAVVALLAVAALAVVALGADASTNLAGSVFLNCGGLTFTQGSNVWQSDDSVAPGGSAYFHNDTILFAKGSVAEESDIFQSARFFGSQSAGLNTYSINVSTAGYHAIRLYFAEILYQTPGLRTFSVWIQDTPVLKNFTLDSVNTIVIQEFYFPILSGIVNITFVREQVGDPFVSAIEIVPATGLYPWLQGAQPKSKVWKREFGVNCGESVAYWPDEAGRMWLPDLPFTDNGTKTDIPYYTIDTSNSRVATIIGTNQAPEYLPERVYESGRLVSNSDAELTYQLQYRFPVAAKTYYRVRFHLAELFLRTTGYRTINFLINGKPVMSDIDSAQVAPQKAFYADFMTLTTSKYLEVQVAAKGNSAYRGDPLLSGLEIFRPLSRIENLTAVPYAAPASPPLALPSESSSVTGSKAGNSWKAAWQGIAVGAALMLGIFGVVSVFLFTRLMRRSADKHDLESKLVGSTWSDMDPKSGRKYYGSPKQEGGACLKFIGHRSPSIGSEDGIWGRMGGPSGARPFTYAELESATNKFSQEAVVGRGGFGSVYKATLLCGTEVAVKRLAIESEQGEKEFSTEVALLTRLHHRNLVNLIGYCEEHGQLMLVYEFVPNGTLREHLVEDKKADSLGWPARVRILLGAARGIEYLHQGAVPAVIHRDIKTSNILLENTLEAKVADFGLSKLGKVAMELDATHISTAVKGTIGYVDPQYYKTKRLTEKSDVFSFGVVMLEVITGKLPIWIDGVSSQDDSTASTFTDSTSDSSEWVDRVNILVDWALPSIKAGNAQQIGAPQLHNLSLPLQPSLQTVAELAARCVEVQPKDRPTMTEVVRKLEGAAGLVLRAGTPASKVDASLQSPSTPPTPSEIKRPLLTAPRSTSVLAFGSLEIA